MKGHTLLTLMVWPVKELSSSWAVINNVPLLRFAVTDSGFESLGSLIWRSSLKLQLFPILILMIPSSRVISKASSEIESEIGIDATQRLDLYSHSMWLVVSKLGYALIGAICGISNGFFAKANRRTSLKLFIVLRFISFVNGFAVTDFYFSL